MKPKQQIIGIVIIMLLQFAVLVSNVSAAERRYSLLLAEYGEDADGEQTQTLVRYYFKNGTMVSKDSILTTKTDDLRYDLGRNQIYKDRYVITNWGDVIDLTTRQMIFKSHGELLGVDKSSDAVVVKVERDEDSGIYAFDLTSHQYNLIQPPSPWTMPGTASPNGQLSASGDGDEIWLHRPNGEKILLGSGYTRGGTSECSSTEKPTFLWIDDMHLLTQRGNGHLVIVDLEGKTKRLVTIADADKFPCGPELRRDGDNQIYYEGGEKDWRIDADNRTFEPYLREASGNGFDMDHEANDSYGQAIRYQGREIGRWWCGQGITAPGHIAVIFGPVGSNLGYPEGVKIWSAENGLWTTIKPDWLVTIIGWIEDSDNR